LTNRTRDFRIEIGWMSNIDSKTFDVARNSLKGMRNYQLKPGS